MQAFPASDLCHHQNHLPDRLHDDGCGADNRAWMMSSRQSPTTMYRSWVWCTECSSLDVCGTLWTNLLPRTKNKATIEVFAGQSNEESVWETTTYCPSTRLVSRSKSKTPSQTRGRFFCRFWRRHLRSRFFGGRASLCLPCWGINASVSVQAGSAVAFAGSSRRLHRSVRLRSAGLRVAGTRPVLHRA